ncbi:MAG: hypothetical protein FJW66_00695 [Actinobacteria bacterium]|nr:hypothetical protein [Actinomycetota bacterium]
MSVSIHGKVRGVSLTSPLASGYTMEDIFAKTFDIKSIIIGFPTAIRMALIMPAITITRAYSIVD